MASVERLPGQNLHQAEAFREYPRDEELTHEHVNAIFPGYLEDFVRVMKEHNLAPDDHILVARNPFTTHENSRQRYGVDNEPVGEDMFYLGFLKENTQTSTHSHTTGPELYVPVRGEMYVVIDGVENVLDGPLWVPTHSEHFAMTKDAPALAIMKTYGSAAVKFEDRHIHAASEEV